MFSFDPADRIQTPNSDNERSRKAKEASDRAQPDRGARATEGTQRSKTITITTKITTKRMLEAMGTGEGGVPGGDGSGRSEGSECGEHRRHRILAGRPQRFMPRDPTRLIPATRNGGGEGEATARESGYHAPRMDRITASRGSIWLRRIRRQRRRRIGGTGSGRRRGEDNARGEARRGEVRIGWLLVRGEAALGCLLYCYFSTSDM